MQILATVRRRLSPNAEPIGPELPTLGNSLTEHIESASPPDLAADKTAHSFRRTPRRKGETLTSPSGQLQTCVTVSF